MGKNDKPCSRFSDEKLILLDEKVDNLVDNIHLLTIFLQGKLGEEGFVDETRNKLKFLEKIQGYQWVALSLNFTVLCSLVYLMVHV